MPEMERRNFMGNVLKTVFAGLISSSSDSSVASQTEIGNNPSDTEIPDLTFHRENGLYLEIKNEEMESSERFINLDSEHLDRLDPEHPFRAISNLEYDTMDLLTHELESSGSSEELRPKYRSELMALQDNLETEAGSFDEAWEMLRQDAQAASTEFDYIDNRRHKQGRSFVDVPGADIPNSIGPEINSGVYFGEYFDAWMTQENRTNSGAYDTSVLLAFEKGVDPEDVISEEEYFNSENLAEDQEALRKIYESADKSKEDYDFNFQTQR